MRWVCKYFKLKREEIDPELAAIPMKYFPHCVRCGIAPAMKLKGECAFWGKMVDDGESEKTKALLGVDMELHKPGDNADKTRERKEALAIIEAPAAHNQNARQVMLRWKERRSGPRNSQH